MMKYPRTPHVRGSAIQRGDRDLSIISFDDIQNKSLVIEEKLDGANCGISFEGDKLVLQSRGHTLSGADHAQFDLFKAWATAQQSVLRPILGTRYLMFGEWMFAKHTVFYDALPHYFMEFDVYDKQSRVFLTTENRHSLLEGSGIISVPVLHEGEIDNIERLVAFVQTSLFKTPMMIEHLRADVGKAGLDPDKVVKQSDISMLGEGLYIKDETSGVVNGRYKWVRPDFIQIIKDSGSHWMGRRIVQNRLAPDVNIFA